MAPMGRAKAQLLEVDGLVTPGRVELRTPNFVQGVFSIISPRSFATRRRIQISFEAFSYGETFTTMLAATKF
jgi:hypothetical protein